MPNLSHSLVEEMRYLKSKISDLELERARIILNSFGGASDEDAIALGAEIAGLKVEIALWQLAKSAYDNDVVRAYKYCNQLYIARASLVDVDVAENPDMLTRDVVMETIGRHINNTDPFEPEINERAPNIVYLTRIHMILVMVENSQTN